MGDHEPAADIAFNQYNSSFFSRASAAIQPRIGIRDAQHERAPRPYQYQMDCMVGTETIAMGGGRACFPFRGVYVRDCRTVSNSFATEFGNTAGEHL